MKIDSDICNFLSVPIIQEDLDCPRYIHVYILTSVTRVTLLNANCIFCVSLFTDF
jgi:hypothetical protein